MKKYSCVVVGLLLTNLVWCQTSQTDSARQLNQVFIKGLRATNLNSASVVQTLSTTDLLSRQGSTMAEVLQENTPVFIRNYGSGGLATASFRGSNAYHTPVIWNGINIQNPVNGQIDFSSIPVFLSDEISLQYGGNGGVWGSGAMAGLLFINSAVNTSQKLKVELLASAFNYGLFQQGAKVSFNYKKLFSSIKLFLNTGDNSFMYSYRGQDYYQKNAGLNDKGFQQVLAYRADAKNTITGLLWYNESDKQIASSLNAAFNNANQKDKNVRTAVTWNNKGTMHSNEVKLAYYYDEIFYSSYDIPRSLSRSNTFNLTEEHQITFNSQNSIHFGINNWFAFANVDGYEQQVNQNRLAGFAYYKLGTKKIKMQQQFGLRSELVNEKFIPLMPSYAMQLPLAQNVLFKVNVARTYRLPTFNDLYWKNGGNINLQPEQGWSSDCAFTYIKNKDKWNYDVTLSVFYRSTENYIQWIPVNAAVFSPINIGNVNARGVELMAKTTVQTSENTSLKGSYLGSFLQAVDQQNDLQLIFTPRIKHVFNILFLYKSLTLKYNHIYTGVSFTKSDHSEWNDDFDIGNFVVSKSFTINRQNKLNLQAAVNNVWDKSYLVMPDRPMPLRNYQLTLQYTLN